MSGSPELRTTRDPADDAGPDYMNDLEHGQDAEVLDEMFQAVEPDAAAAPAGAAQTPAAGQRGIRDVIRGKPAAKPAEGNGGVLSTAGAVAGDVIGGIAESPKSLVKGVRDAGQEFLDSTKSVGDWLNHNVGDLGAVQIFDKQGNFDPQYFSTTPDDARPTLPGENVRNNTVTGSVITGVTQFLAGYAAGGKVLKTAGLAGKLGTFGEAALKGMFSDAFAFDPAQERLSNLIQSVPALQNPVTDFLSAKEDDSEAGGRLKAALEGLGVGTATAAVFATALRGMRFLKDVKAEMPPPELKPEMLAPLGDISEGAPLVSKVTPTQAEKAMKAAEKATAETKPGELRPSMAAQDVGASAGKTTKGDEVYFNFARVETPDDVKSLMAETQKLFKGDIETAQRGVQSFEATKALADDMGMTVEDLLNRPRAEGGARTPFTAEEALAARRLYTASSERLMALAERAAGPNAGEVDMFAFRKMMATHYAIQQEVIGARTETARALGSWKIPAGTGAEQLKAIEDTLNMSGGAAAAKQMAQRLAILKANGASPKDVAKFVRKGVFGNSVDAVREVWINGLLSSPTTHIVNTSSNSLVQLQTIYERKAAQMIARGLGTDTVAQGEASGMAWAMLEGYKDLFRLGWKKFLLTGPAEVATKIENANPMAISAESFGMSKTGAGRVVDLVGSIVRSPGAALNGEDKFFKTVGYRMELRAQAIRTATGEGLRGKQFAQRVADLIQNPPENLRLGATDAALYMTFTNQAGWFAKGIQQLRSAGGQANPMWLVVPFIKTPANISRYAFERTPLAPLVGQWRADIAAGGARRELALSRMATGTAIMGVTMGWVQEGLVSGAGPSDPRERAALQRQGWQPYSAKIGDKWYSYNRTDPFGMTMGFAADIEAAMSRGEIAPEDIDEWQEVMGAGIASVSQVTISKTYLRGLAQLTETMADPKRYSGRYISDMMASFIPFTSLVGAVERVTDPTVRTANNPLEAIQAKIPILSQRMAPARDLWGKEVRRFSGYGAAYDAISPIATAEIVDSPIDKELERLRYFPGKIGWKTSLDGVPVNLKDFPEVYSDYQRLAGNELKHPAWGLGLKDYLDAVVSGKHPMSQAYRIYSDGEEGGKAAFIRNAVQDYRKLAAEKILSDPKHIRFKAYYQEQASVTRGARQRVTIGQ